QPIDISVGHSEHINLFVPKGALDRPGRALHGTLFHRDRLPCRMLTQHLLYLLESVSASRKAPVAVLVRTTLAVLQRCLGASSREQGSQIWVESLQERVLAHIESQLGDPALGPATLQKKFRI